MNKQAEVQRAREHKPAVSRLMMLAIELRHSPIEVFDERYKALQNALYDTFGLNEAEPPRFHLHQVVRHLETKNLYLITGTPAEGEEIKVRDEWLPGYSYIPFSPGPVKTKSRVYHRTQLNMEDGRFVAVELVEKSTQGNPT